MIPTHGRPVQRTPTGQFAKGHRGGPGRPRGSGKPPRDRFMALVTKLPGGCWRWDGGSEFRIHRDISSGDKPNPRVASYRLFVDAQLIPKAHTIAARCGNERCVAPAHLLVIPAGKIDLERYPCGHPRTPENSYKCRHPARAGRKAIDGWSCRTCHNSMNMQNRLRKMLAESSSLAERRDLKRRIAEWQSYRTNPAKVYKTRRAGWPDRILKPLPPVERRRIPLP